MAEPSDGTLKMRVMVAAAIVLAVAAIVWVALWITQPTSYDLKLATGSTGGTYLPLGKGIADVVEGAYDHIEIEVVESAGAVDNMQRLQRGEVDLAFIQNDTTGSGKIRTVVPLYREVLHFLVRNDSGIETLRDIRGKRISIGKKDSGTAALVQALLGHYDLDTAQFEPHYMGATEAVDQLISGEIDAMLFVVGIKSEACRRAAASGEVHFVGLGTPGVDAGEIEGFRFDYPFAEPYVIPVLTYASPTGGKPEKPIATIAIRAVLATRADVPEDAIRQITAAIFAGRTELIRSHGNSAEIRERFDDTWLQYPVHRGAQAYYRRDEPGFLVTYAELMGFILSMVVFLMAAYAGLREWIIRRKKNRIDVYYTRLDEILTELRDQGCSSERLEELDEELIEMQTRAFKQLVAEQLRADESFRIFQDFQAQCRTQIAQLRVERASSAEPP